MMMDDKDESLKGEKDPYESILDDESDVDPFDVVLNKQPVKIEKPVKPKVTQVEDFFNPISTKKKDLVKGDGSSLGAYITVGTIAAVFIVLLYLLVAFLDALFTIR